MSVRARLTIWYAAALGTLLVAFACGIYVFVQRGLTHRLDESLADQLKLITGALADEQEELRELAETNAVPYFAVRQADQLVHCSSAWKRAGLAVPLVASVRAQTILDAAQHEYFRMATAAVTAREQRYLVAVAISARPLRRTLETLTTILAIGLPLGLLVALAGGNVLAGRVLRPIQVITAKTQEIDAERLAERLPVFATGDELDRLATVINGLLTRLQEAFARLRRFTADASHELRTPLTAIRTVGEVALQETANSNEESLASLKQACRQYRDAIGSMLEEINRLTYLLEDLLTLTRADADRVVLAKEPIELGPLVREAVDLMRPVAEEKDLFLNVESDSRPRAEVDRGTLRQALLNLLDNAIKYTPAGGSVRLQVYVRDRAAVIEVTDTGLGIAPEEQARVFERFYRVDPSRSVERGAGLGLSLAQWAVAANGGRIELASVVGRGSTFRIVLPLSET